MLTKLHIQNYAIINEIEILFNNKLNIITGETGAGKSILMGALSLILGERADTTALLNNQKKCFVEGFFAVQENKNVQHFLEQHELDINEELVLRREITPNGKTRAFINDTPATLQQLKNLANLLVDLHQQFDTMELGNSQFQRQVIDALANNANNLTLYQNTYKALQQCKKQLEDLQQQKANFTKEADYNQFLYDELNELGLKENELEQQEAELKLLTNSEDVKSTLNKVYAALNEVETPIVQTLKQLTNQLNAFAEYHNQLPAIIGRMQSTQIELQDIAQEIDSINGGIYFDEKRINVLNDKLAAGYKLLKKHGLKTTNDLLALQISLQQKLQAVLNIDEAIANKEKETKQLQKQATEQANILSVARHAQVAPLQQKVNNLLQQVGMPNAILKVDIQDCTLQVDGKDAIEFLFDANKSNKFEPIRKVASGGELSRLMLCIKSLVAQSINLPTMIFDEIDTGISGEAAKQVGIIMKQMASKRQIICITHQPQIAGKANAHFFVYKEIKGNTIATNIRLLNADESITAIAKMLSGEQPTAAAIESAKEMMN